MADDLLVLRTQDFIKERLSFDKSGHHDWWHVLRVLKLARHVAAEEKGVDLLVVELGALLHDVADWKFTDGDLTVGPRMAREWLQSQRVPAEVIDKVVYIVEHISYRGGTNKHVMQSLEGQIVQDADRLDAVGAIGIARTFTFGGAQGRAMYNPALKPQSFTSFKAYRDSIKEDTTINHFYEKLLLLKDKMNTDTGRQLAEHRHKVMEDFLEEFHAEWEGER